MVKVLLSLTPHSGPQSLGKKVVAHGQCWSSGALLAKHREFNIPGPAPLKSVPQSLQQQQMLPGVVRPQLEKH